jgi:hypothetical protein
VFIDTDVLQSGSGVAAGLGYSWLERTLAGCTAQWLIVVGHHSILSGKHCRFIY